MSKRSRIQTFGGAGMVVLAGVACAVFVPDGLGQILAIVLIGVGLVLATGLVFLEVGLSEDRERAREAAAAREREDRERRAGEASGEHVARDPKAGRAPRRRRLERMRGRPRRPG